MKILNLYAGIGGNRKYWTGEITAVEKDKQIASVYKKYYPDDNVIIADAHQYLLENFNKYDFIWSSPPCVSHSVLKRMGIKRGIFKYEYPDMRLYQEIILLREFAKGVPYVIENVRGYYKPLIPPSYVLGRHYFWSNIRLNIKDYDAKSDIRGTSNTDKFKATDTIYGFNITQENIKSSKKIKILRNLVSPVIGKLFFDNRKNIIYFNQKEIFNDKTSRD